MQALSPTSPYGPKTVNTANGPVTVPASLAPNGAGMSPQFSSQSQSPTRLDYAHQQQQQQQHQQHQPQQSPQQQQQQSSPYSSYPLQIQSQSQPPAQIPSMPYDNYSHNHAHTHNPHNHNHNHSGGSGMPHMDYSSDPKSPRRVVPQSLAVGQQPPQAQQQQQTSTASSSAQPNNGNPAMQQMPEFKRLRALTDLNPKVNAQPPFRRANPEGGFISPLQALTVHLPATYRICNPGFKYESSRNPRRVLTKPSKGVKNDGYDNEDSDYILYVNDILGSEEAGHKNRYLILDVLGQGTFGQVVKCQNLKTQEVVAVKVIKNRTAYFNQSMMEVSVLDLLNTKLDKNDDHHLLRLKDTFIHRQHLCLVFELLSVNLYELIKQNQFRGLSTTLVRVFAQQLLNGLTLLNKARLIHCDLKPENILLKNLESPIIKIIDFGSACDERQTVYTYIQSRFYRSPEVLLGLPYSSAIDMWSLGCIVVELFLGLPLFPGSSEYNQVARIVEMLGNPANWMIEMGKQGSQFFEKSQDDYGRRTYRLKSMEQYSRERSTKEQPSKKYFSANTLPEIIRTYPMPRKNMKQSEIEREMNNRVAFIDFVRGLLNTNPLERWSPQQAKLHPFITQSKFTGPFVPPMNLKSSSLNRSPAPGTQQQLQAEAVSKQRAQAAQGIYANSVAAAQQQFQQQQQQPQNPLSPQQQAYNNAATNVYNPGQPSVGVTSGSNQTAPNYGQPQQPLGQPGNYTQMPDPANFQAQPQFQQQQQQAQSQPQPNQVPSQAQQLPNQYANQPPASAAGMYSAAQNRARPRASTMEQQQSGIPAAIQRVASHLDPTQPIRLQPSPAYYPPGAETGLAGMDGVASRRRGSRTQASARGNRDFIRTLEERTLEEGYMGGSTNPWR
ncbi:Serine/threonine-protein kinase ppk15 [Ceratocystis platani]|uniref:Serine/threonine-protein kinase ppk15 n=1 Tax=Ceratocystis fimbriata f. sp. platani TaxID=88771 RepID=A0A0F8B4P1_CERFI|nr:Serine/threonine-protein kinase ppk15 [Ceratocystis platani]